MQGFYSYLIIVQSFFLAAILHGQHYNNEFQVNTNPNAQKNYVNVSVLRDGGFVVCWTNYTEDDDGFDRDCYGQVLNQDGSKRGNEFRINAFIEGEQNEPVVQG
ncbi:hypothetical protein JW935_12505 [candidate division KSB1 bacterium]|nr:hypothetical protein [candidate division KSB1 bacterium]